MPQTFAQRLRDARKEAGYPSLESLAVKVGCVKQTLSNIEKGLQAEVKMLLLYELADTLHVSPRWLATGKGTRRNTGPMSDYERDLILILRQLKADDQDYIVKLAERIAATTAETPSPVVPFVKAPAPARK